MNKNIPKVDKNLAKRTSEIVKQAIKEANEEREMIEKAINRILKLRNYK